MGDTRVPADRTPAPPPAGRRRLRVSHVIHSLGPGGAESVLAELALVAPRVGLDLAVVALSAHPRPVHAVALRAAGVEVVQLDRARWDPRALPGALAALRRQRPDVVHTHLKHADLVGGAAAALLRVPVVSTLHVVEDAPVSRMARYKRTAGLMGRRRVAARTIALSARQLAWYRRLSGSDAGLVVLPNGVADPGPADLVAGARLRSELGVGPGRSLVVSASLMRPEKGHHLLLDAVSALPARLDLLVALAGDGELRPELVARVDADPALRDRIRFLGYRDDVPELLAAADLVLHTSLADALPTTLMQALAVGTPIVATDVGGIPDIVGPDAGLVVPTDAAALADAVTTLVDDADLRRRLGESGRARFLDLFEAEGWAHRLRGLYETVLSSS